MIGVKELIEDKTKIIFIGKENLNFIGQSVNSTSGQLHVGVNKNNIQNKAFPPFDANSYPSQILWLAITFGLFYFFLKNVILPRISDILEARRNRIDQDIRHATRIKEETDSIIASYELELVEARSKAHAEALSARALAQTQAEEERKTLVKSLGSKILEAEERINTKKIKAEKNIAAISQEISDLIVDKFSNKTDGSDFIINTIKSMRE